MYTVEEMREILVEMKRVAAEAAQVMYNRIGGDRYPCGFAWVEIHGIKGNTKLGRVLKEAGVEQDYKRVFSIWNPSKSPVQNIDIKEAGAEAAAEYLRAKGFKAYACSRLD